MKIKTSHDFPAIPDRRFDYSAVDDDTYDGPGCPIGRGATEQEAIDDLLEQVEERKEWREYMNGQPRNGDNCQCYRCTGKTPRGGE